MAWFGQGKDTIEWEEFRDDVLFYKWPAKEIKKGAKLIIRPGQKAIFYADGRIEGVFEEPGSFDIASQIVPFLSTLKGVFTLRGDSGMRAEVYFVNAKELLLSWGTRQRIMVPSPQAPAGIPVGCNGNMAIEFRDYQKFIDKIAGVRSTYSLSDISERIMGELNPVLCEAILDGQQSIGASVIISLQRDTRKLGKHVCEELDKELFDIGLGVADFNIMSFTYPPEVQKMAEKVAAQSFVGDVGRFASVNMAEGMGKAQGVGGEMASMGAQMAMGMEMARQMQSTMSGAASAPSPAASPAGQTAVCPKCQKTLAAGAKFCPECGAPIEAAAQPASDGDRFCPKCRRMTSGKFCSECGTATV